MLEKESAFRAARVIKRYGLTSKLKEEESSMQYYTRTPPRSTNTSAKRSAPSVMG